MKTLSIIILFLSVAIMAPAAPSVATPDVPVMEQTPAKAPKWKKYTLKGYDRLEDVDHFTFPKETLALMRTDSAATKNVDIAKHLINRVDEMDLYAGDSKKFLKKLQKENKRLGKQSGYKCQLSPKMEDCDVRAYFYTEDDLIKEIIVVSIFDDLGMLMHITGSLTQEDLPALLQNTGSLQNKVQGGEK